MLNKEVRMTFVERGDPVLCPVSPQQGRPQTPLHGHQHTGHQEMTGEYSDGTLVDGLCDDNNVEAHNNNYDDVVKYCRRAT